MPGERKLDMGVECQDLRGFGDGGEVGGRLRIKRS